MEEVKIKIINKEIELNRILDILHSSLDQDYPYKKETITSYKNIYSENYFNKFLESNENVLLGAFTKNKIIGFITLEKQHGGVVFIDQLVVDKDYRGKGIGSLLMKEMEKISFESNCHYVYLYTETLKDEKFYLDKGYKYIGTFDNAWFGEVEHIFAKSLKD